MPTVQSSSKSTNDNSKSPPNTLCAVTAQQTMTGAKHGKKDVNVHQMVR